MTERAAISVIIPAYRQSEHLQRVLRAIVAGSRVPAEIIVSHSADHDPSDWIAAQFPDVNVLHSDARLFAGAARNRAAAIATQPVLAFCDSDTVPAAGWIARIERSLQPGTFRVGAVGMEVTGGYWGTVLWLSEFSEQAPFNPEREQMGGASCNFACQAADYAAVGGFDESLRIGEDGKLFSQLRGHGLTQLFDPAMRVGHMNIAGYRHCRDHLSALGAGTVDVHMGHDIGRSWIIRHPILRHFAGALKFGAISLRSLRAFPRHLLNLPGVAVGCAIYQRAIWRALRQHQGNRG